MTTPPPHALALQEAVEAYMAVEHPDRIMAEWVVVTCTVRLDEPSTAARYHTRTSSRMLLHHVEGLLEVGSRLQLTDDGRGDDGDDD